MYSKTECIISLLSTILLAAKYTYIIRKNAQQTEMLQMLRKKYRRKGNVVKRNVDNLPN